VNLGPPRLALVGTDAVLLEDWARQLRPRYQVVIFETFEPILRRHEVEPFAAVVLDIDVDLGSDTALDGFDPTALLRRLRRAHPSVPTIVVSAVATPDAIMVAMRHGAVDFVRKPPAGTDGLARAVEEAVARAQVVSPPVEPPPAAVDMLFGESPTMHNVRRLIARFAGSTLPVMILGRSGTGKELAARALHAASPRARSPFVAINCAGLTETLIDSELFGHERGAFTGAQTSHKGLFDSADGGTLFLDEIGDVPPQTQVRLLRALQEGEVRPVGATKLHHVDVRIISATNVEIMEAVAAKRFRQDLYYRLSPIKIELPPLHARGADVVLLAERLLTQSAAQARRRVPRLSSGVIDALLHYEWPGNVRELKSAMEYALSLARGETIDIEDLPPSVTGDPRWRTTTFALPEANGEAPAPNYAQERRQWLAEFDRRYFEQLLRYTKGNLSEASRHSGVDRSNLRRMLKDIGLDAADFRQQR
jgi:DNA-binding NtrC family response regulator